MPGVGHSHRVQLKHASNTHGRGAPWLAKSPSARKGTGVVVSRRSEQSQRKPDGGHFVAISSRSAAISAQRPYTALSASLQGFRSLAWAAVDSRYALKR